MRFIVEDNRQLYIRAKEAFNHSDAFMQFAKYGRVAIDYWNAFGEHNNMKVIIKEWQGPYPVVEALEFNTEADYVWFLLRYS